MLAGMKVCSATYLGHFHITALFPAHEISVMFGCLRYNRARAIP